MTRWRALAGLVVLGTTLLLARPLLADADGDDPVAELRAAVDRAMTDLNEAQVRLAELDDSRRSIEARIVDQESTIEELDLQVREIAVQRYVGFSGGVPDPEDPNELLSADQLGAAAGRFVEQTLADHAKARDELAELAEELADTSEREDEVLETISNRADQLQEQMETLEDLGATGTGVEVASVDLDGGSDWALVTETAQVTIQTTTTTTTTTVPPTTAPPATTAPATNDRPARTTTTESRASVATTPPTTSRPTPTTTKPTPTTSPPTTSPPATTKAALDRCPVNGPVSFQDWWHAARSGGRVHEGLDMFAPMGTPVVAPVSGTVMHTEYPLGGKVFRMWGDNGWFYYGAHLSDFGADGWVSAGTVIGYVGDTGNAQGLPPHLHFEAHPVQGNPVNPYSAARQVC